MTGYVLISLLVGTQATGVKGTFAEMSFTSNLVVVVSVSTHLAVFACAFVHRQQRRLSHKLNTNVPAERLAR